MNTKKRNAPEAEHQQTYFAVLAINERKFPCLTWIHSSQNGASASSPASAMLRRKLGQKKGVVDICIPYPRRSYHGAWVELKIKPNATTPEQRLFLQAMTDNGYLTAVCWSCDELLDFTEEYFGITLCK